LKAEDDDDDDDDDDYEYTLSFFCPALSKLMKTLTYHPSMACVTAARSCMQTSHRRESSLARSLARPQNNKQASKPSSNTAR
jgi:hypothetical protein